MKTTQTLLGKYQNPMTKDEYLVLEIKNFDHVIDRFNKSERPLIRRRYETFDGIALQHLGGLDHPRFLIENTNMVIERSAWSG